MVQRDYLLYYHDFFGRDGGSGGRDWSVQHCSNSLLVTSWFVEQLTLADTAIPQVPCFSDQI